MQDLITVVVPVYNVSNYLDRCMDSLLAQTYQNLDIILVNDGSTDNSGELCDTYAKKDARIRVVHKDNGGLSSARNVGISMALGKYIGFVDSDDWVTEDMFEYLHGLLTGNCADVAVSNLVRCKSVSDANKIMKSHKESSIKTYSQEEYIKKFMKIDSQTIEYYAWNKLYKKELLTSKQYPDGKTAEDVLGTFKALLNANRIVQSNKVTYFYYVNPTSITASFSEKKANDLLYVWDEVVKLSKDNELYHSWAILNRARIDFTILFQIAVAKNYMKLIRDEEFVYSIINRLKVNKYKLLSMNLSLLRKLLIRLFCFNYSFSSRIINFIIKL